MFVTAQNDGFDWVDAELFNIFLLLFSERNKSPVRVDFSFQLFVVVQWFVLLSSVINP